jgi:hypothetical protein
VSKTNRKCCCSTIVQPDQARLAVQGVVCLAAGYAAAWLSVVDDPMETESTYGQNENGSEQIGECDAGDASNTVWLDQFGLAREENDADIDEVSIVFSSSQTIDAYYICSSMLMLTYAIAFLMLYGRAEPDERSPLSRFENRRDLIIPNRRSGVGCGARHTHCGDNLHEHGLPEGA